MKDYCLPLARECFKQKLKKRTRGEGTGHSSWHFAEILGFYCLDKRRKYRKSRRQCFDGQERMTVRASRGIKKNMEGKKVS